MSARQPPSSFPQNVELPFPIVQYANDEAQLLHLKKILQKITLSSGMKMNYHKSCLVPINMDVSKATSLAEALWCVVGSFPFTYLGLPLGLTNPQVKHYAPLICWIERRLSASSKFLSYAGRLQLINSMLSSLPTYYMCSLKLLSTVTEEIDKYRKNCLCRSKYFNQKKYNLADSDLVNRPKDRGGLGVINLNIHNTALLLKLDKFYRKKKEEWVSFIWNKYYRGLVPPSC
jgi:hypothetical protein